MFSTVIGNIFDIANLEIFPLNEHYIWDLTRPCDACGKMIEGGFKSCPKCQIYFCFTCCIELMYLQRKSPIECPMCGGKLE
jgi:hypothetical protein